MCILLCRNGQWHRLRPENMLIKAKSWSSHFSSSVVKSEVSHFTQELFFCPESAVTAFNKIWKDAQEKLACLIRQRCMRFIPEPHLSHKKANSETVCILWRLAPPLSSRMESRKEVFLCYILHTADWQDFLWTDHIMRRVSPASLNVVVSIRTKTCMCFWSNQVSYWKRRISAHFLWVSCSINYRLLLLFTFAFIATQTIRSLTSLEVFILWFDAFLSVCRQIARDLSSVLPFIVCLSIAFASCGRELSLCGGLHVDLGALTSTRWACGLAAASRLLFCLHNGITSTKRKKKKKMQSAVPGPSSFIQPFRQVLRVWFAGCWVQRTHTQTLGRSETLSHGISCRSPRNEALGAHLMGFAWLDSAKFCFGKHFGGLRIEGVLCCTDRKAPWDKFVIFDL